MCLLGREENIYIYVLDKCISKSTYFRKWRLGEL